MTSEYEPVFRRSAGEASDDLDRVRARFEAASRPFLRAPWSWLAWALLMPAAALATRPVLARWGPAGVLLLWSGAILCGGAVEAISIARGGRSAPRSPLSSWVLRIQGNTSLLAVVLSALVLWLGAPWALPGIWLLMLGHSFYLLGGLAFAPFRAYGLLFQLAGLAALWPGGRPLLIFAGTAAVGNLWMAWSVWREAREG